MYQFRKSTKSKKYHIIIHIIILLSIAIPACTVSDPKDAIVVSPRFTASLTPHELANDGSASTPTSTLLLIPTSSTQPSKTPTVFIFTATATITPSPTAVPPTITPSYSPTPIPQSVIENEIVSSQGQLSYINSDLLFVETRPMSGEFLILGEFAQTAAWSPDGETLVYSLASSSDLHEPTATFRQYLWSVSDQVSMPISDLIPTYPNSHYRVLYAFWSPDNTKILFQAVVEEQILESDSPIYDYLLIAVDLNQRISIETQYLTLNHSVVWLSNSSYILRYHCGSPCAAFDSYDYVGELLWRLPWDTGGFVDFSEDGDFMINVGRIPDRGDTATIDEIDVLSGTIKEYWHKPITRPEYFTAFYNPHISPDKQYIGFNYGGGFWPTPGTFIVIDRAGQERGRFDNSYLVDWHLDNMITIDEIFDSGENQLLLVSVNGENREVIATLPDSIVLGKWSPNGHYFVFTTETISGKDGKLFLWQLGQNEPMLIDESSNRRFRNIIWLPNSQGFYISEGNSDRLSEKIWLYKVNSNELICIARGN